MLSAILPETHCKKLHLFVFIQSALTSINALNGVIWSAQTNAFVPIYSIPEFAALRQTFLLNSREEETHDFKGRIVIFTSTEIKNMIFFRDNNTRVTGINGDIWTMLSEYLNFKLLPVKVNGTGSGSRDLDGSWNGVMGIIGRNKTDVIPRTLYYPSRLEIMQLTLPLWTAGFRLYIKEEWKFDPAWMMHLFSPKVWIAFSTLLGILCVASFFLHCFTVVEKTKKQYPTGGEYVMSIISLICNQGYMPQVLERRSKILLLSVSLCSWLMALAFSSTLISHIAQRDFNPPFLDLQSLYDDTHYNVLTMNDTMIQSAFLRSVKPIYGNIYKARRAFFMSSIDEVEENLCTKKEKNTFLEAEDIVDSKIFVRCEVNPVGKPIFDNWIGSGIVRGFKNKRAIDVGLLKLHESGLIHVLKSRWLPGIKKKQVRNTPKSIRLQHVSRIFAILYIGMFMSALICLMENAVYVAYYYKTDETRAKRRRERFVRKRTIKTKFQRLTRIYSWN